MGQTDRHSTSILALQADTCVHIRPRLDHLRRLSLLCLVIFVLSVFSDNDALATATIKQTSHSSSQTENITSNNPAPGTLYNWVSLLPIQAENRELSSKVSLTFFNSFKKTKKYSLFPYARSSAWYYDQPVIQRYDQKTELMVTAGKSFKTRGVISGNFFRTIGANSDNILAFQLNLKMVDIETRKTVWDISTTIEESENQPADIDAIINKTASLTITRLLKKMVDKGDSFSLLLPQPRLISISRKQHSTFITLQPDLKNFKGYEILRSESPKGIYQTVVTADSKDAAPQIFQDQDVDDDTIYYYKIVGITPAGLTSVPDKSYTADAPKKIKQTQLTHTRKAIPETESSRKPKISPKQTAVPKTDPVVVQGFRAVQKLRKGILLTWKPNTKQDVSYYEIFRGVQRGESTLKAGEVSGHTLSFWDKSARPDTVYYYWIRAVCENGKVGKLTSPVRTVTEPGPTLTKMSSGEEAAVPSPPTGIAIELFSHGIKLIWQPNQNMNGLRYEIFTTGSSTAQVGATTDPFFQYEIAVAPRHRYQFQIRTVDNQGQKSKFSLSPVLISGSSILLR